jgi:hypothetical protein
MNKFKEQQTPKSNNRNVSPQPENRNKQNPKPAEAGDRSARPQRPEAREAE